MEVEARLTGNEETLQLLGVDVFALAQVTPALLAQPAVVSETAEGANCFVTLADDRLFLSAAAQAALGVKTGDRLRQQAGTQPLSLSVAGDLPVPPRTAASR